MGNVLNGILGVMKPEINVDLVAEREANEAAKAAKEKTAADTEMKKKKEKIEPLSNAEVGYFNCPFYKEPLEEGEEQCHYCGQGILWNESFLKRKKGGSVLLKDSVEALPDFVRKKEEDPIFLKDEGLPKVETPVVEPVLSDVKGESMVKNKITEKDIEKMSLEELKNTKERLEAENFEAREILNDERILEGPFVDVFKDSLKKGILKNNGMIARIDERLEYFAKKAEAEAKTEVEAGEIEFFEFFSKLFGLAASDEKLRTELLAPLKERGMI